jgi:RNA polymerase sigma-70 factor (ECF subfamily)
MSADLNLAFADYAASFQEDREGALFDLQCLFLQESTCLARMEFLRALANAEGRPIFSPRWSATEFTREIQAISRFGLFAACRQGLITPARLVALACDPNALWQVHRALVETALHKEDKRPPGSPLGRTPPDSCSPGRRISQIESQWSVLRQAHDGTPDEVHEAQQVVMRRYRPAVYRYLLACLGNPDAADEVCQEFCLRFVRGDFRNANPEKGRFRDLLKAALYHLVIDYHQRAKRGMPQLGSKCPEPTADPESTLDSDRQFITAWRADLLSKAWDALAAEEQRSGRPLHTVLHFRASHPEMRSAQVAEQLSSQRGKAVTADWVRKWLHAAREKFAELLLREVAASLDQATTEAVVQELIDLELFEYCKVAVDRWRREQQGEEM